MRVKNEYLHTIPMIKIRDFLRVYSDGFTKKELKNYFNLSDIETTQIIKSLLQKELVQIELKGDYTLSDNGYMLCRARSVSPIKKEKADKLFNEFLQRVNEVNNDDFYLWKVEKLYLFGSYLDKTKDDYGDIDIGYILERKITDSVKYNKLRMERLNAKLAEGKQLISIDDKLSFPKKDVLLKLKNKCRYISLQPYDEDLFNKFIYKEIYP